jgi:NADP-dependent 3-hydroxy acid dehydrogenase YdfG
LRGDQSGVAYQATKAGVLALSRGTEYEESRNNIRSSVILPGLCDTPLVQKRPQPPSRDMLDRSLKPEDVARCVAFIAGLPDRVLIPELVVVPTAIQNPFFRA